MTSDLTYTDALDSLQGLLEQRSTVIDFQFVFSFNHWLLGCLLDDLREGDFPGDSAGTVEVSVEALNQVCDLATSLLSTFIRTESGRSVEVLAMAAGALEQSYAFRTVLFCMHRALSEVTGPNPRWANGNALESLVDDSRRKQQLTCALVDEVFGALRQMACSLKTCGVDKFWTRMGAVTNTCQSALHILWSIGRCESSGQVRFTPLRATLDSELDSKSIEDGGVYAETMHQVWFRLYREIATIESNAELLSPEPAGRRLFRNVDGA